MDPKKLMFTLILQSPIALLIGIMCAVAYTLEFEESVSIKWPIAVIVAAVFLALSIGREIREDRNEGRSKDTKTTNT